MSSSSSTSSSSCRARAEQAKARAEERFRRKDVAGARAAALDAKSLFPGLPGLAPALAAYQVHFAAAACRRLLPSGAVDWRAVLDVPRDAAPDAVRRQFRRLCLLTHPDKNASAAADGAFKLVVKAYENASAAFASATTAPASAGSRRRRGAAASAGGQTAPAGGSGFHSYPRDYSRPGASASASASDSASDSAAAKDDGDGDKETRARVVEIALTCPYCGSGSMRVAVKGDRVTATAPCPRCSRYFAVPKNERR